MDFRLKDKGLVPERGWRALQPESQEVIKAGTREDLKRKIREYREANSLPIENNFDRQIDNQVCLAMGGDEQARRCRYLSSEDSKNPPTLRAWKKGRQDLKDFAIAAQETIREKASGGTLHVSKEEAEARAGICAKCEENLPIAPCFGCGALGSLYREITGRTETAYDSLLQSCGVCGCANKTQVHMSAELLATIASRQGHRASDFPDWCWKKAILSE